MATTIPMTAVIMATVPAVVSVVEGSANRDTSDQWNADQSGITTEIV
jgi:hypothetical protein